MAKIHDQSPNVVNFTTPRIAQAKVITPTRDDGALEQSADNSGIGLLETGAMAAIQRRNSDNDEDQFNVDDDDDIIAFEDDGDEGLRKNKINTGLGVMKGAKKNDEVSSVSTSAALNIRGAKVSNEEEAKTADKKNETEASASSLDSEVFANERKEF